VRVTAHLYDRLFRVENPEADKEVDFIDQLNTNSRVTVSEAVAEPSISDLQPGETVQFERLGYFCPDSKTSSR
jgi:glutaminyl-tRNA synthetase